MTRQTYEGYDQNVRLVVLLSAALVAVVALAVGVVALQYRWLGGEATRVDPGPAPLAGQRLPLTGPVLEVDPTAELEALRAREEALLHTYGWVDRQRGVVRIPIERAMELEASK